MGGGLLLRIEHYGEWVRLLNAVYNPEPREIHVNFYGLLHTSIGMRTATLTAFNLAALKEAVQSLWPQFNSLDREVFLVHPQPEEVHEQGDHVCAIVEFIDQMILPSPEVTPILQECFVHSTRSVQRAAAYCQRTLTLQNVRVDGELCGSLDLNDRRDFWLKHAPLTPGTSFNVEPGDLLTIRTMPSWTHNTTSQAVFSVAFPGAAKFSRNMIDISAQTNRQPATWTFIGVSEFGREARIDYFNPNWEEVSDSARVISFFQHLVSHYGLDETHSVHHVVSQHSIDAVFVYGPRSNGSVLAHVAYSAQWVESWHQQFCHLLPYNASTESFAIMNQVPEDNITVLQDGSIVQGRLNLYNGISIEVEFKGNANDTESNVSSTDHVIPSKASTDDTFLTQVWSVPQSRVTGTTTGHNEPRNVPLGSLSTHVTDRWCDSLSSCDVQGVASKARITQVRPNGDIVPDQDSQVPYQYRLHNGARIPGTIIPPPNWDRLPGLRYACDRGAVVRDAAHQLRVHIRSWLVPHDRFGPMYWKDCTIPAQLFLRLLDRLKSVWRHELLQGDSLRMRIVQPTPAPPIGDQARLYILLECNRPHVSTRKAILISFQEMTHIGPSPDMTWVPYLAPGMITLQIIAGVLPTPCDPRHLIIPAGTPDRRWLAEQDERAVDDGLYLPVLRNVRRGAPTQRIDIEESTLLQTGMRVDSSPNGLIFGRSEPFDEVGTLFDEAVSPMQTGGRRDSSRSPRRADGAISTSTQSSYLPFLIHAYRLSREHRVISLDRASTQTLAEQVLTNWAAPSHQSIVDLHIVNSPPIDLDSTADGTYLVEFASDRQRQADPADRLILVDIKIQDASTMATGTHIRRVLWSRSFMSREDMLHLLSSASLCKLVTIHCEVQVNQNLWPADDSARRQMLHGDFVQLNVLGPEAVPSEHIQIALCEQEAADSQRFIYHASPTSSSEHAYDAGFNEAEHDESGEEESPRSNSVSLLQRKAELHGKYLTSSTTASPSDTVNTSGLPHVSDLWCASPVEFNVPDCLAKEEKNLHCCDNSQTRADVKPIILADVIQEPVWMRIPCQELIQLRQDLLWYDLGNVLDKGQVVKWHPETLAAFARTPMWTDEPVLSYDFYTDGSSVKMQKQRYGASAVVLIVQTPVGERFGGFRVFDVPDTATAPKAEALAVCISLLWAHHIGSVHPAGGFPFKIRIGYDCLMAGNVADGTWPVKSHPDIQVHSRALMHWLHKRFGECSQCFHIYSHQGHCWNECADAITWAAVNQWIPTSSSVPFMETISCGGKSHVSAWLWMLEETLQGQANALPYDGKAFILNVAAPFESSPDVSAHPFSQRRGHVAVNNSSHEVTLKAATANVLTLFPGNERPGNYISARQEALMEQFRAEGFQIIGLQETRSKLNGYGAADHFHVLSASATAQGVGGVQFWVSKKFIFDHETLVIEPTDIRIIHSSPQRLVVLLSPCWLRLMMIVAHAPSCQTEDTLTRWWSATSNAIPLSCRDIPCVYMLDANARVGSVSSEVVNTHGQQEENLSGRVFHDWLVSRNIVLPQTFQQHHHGVHNTWTHATGAQARLDYIAVDAVLMHHDVSTWVASEIDLSIQRQDHECVGIKLPITVPSVVDKRDARPDSSVLLGNDKLTVAEEVVDWKVDVHTHASIVARQLGAQVRIDRKPRKKHLQDETWRLIRCKQYHWRRIRQIQAFYAKAVSRVIFQKWRCSRSSTTHECIGRWLKLQDHAIAYHQGCHNRLALICAKKVRQDNRDFYQQLADRTADVAADQGLPSLWKCLRPLLPKAQHKRKSNLRGVGPSIDATRSHFNQLEAGEEVSYSTMVHQCFMAQKEACLESPLELPLASIPTRVQMEGLIKRQRRGKAPGLDGVPIDQLQNQIGSDSLMLFRLFFKSWVLASEPAQHKGGLLHCITKKQGITHDVRSLRGIALLDTTGKVFHAMVRQALLEWAAPRRLPCQFGGFTAQQTLFATHYIRSFTRVAGKRGFSTAILFLDVRSAFHGLLRQHVFGASSSFPQRLYDVLSQEGFDVESLVRNESAHSYEFTATASPHTVRLLQDAHRFTWYTLAGHDGCYMTHRGSRPGSPLADLAYNALMTTLLRELQSQLALRLPQVSSFREHFSECPPAAWVDDVAIPLLAQSPDALDETLADTVEIVEGTFAKYGLKLNMGVGKTEAVLNYRGPGAVQARQRRFVQDMGHLPLNAGSLRVVSDYQYLGTQFSQIADIGFEINTRLGKSSAVFRTLRQHVFGNRRLPVKTRLILLDSLVLSILFHGAGNWPLLSHRTYKKVQHAVITWQRTIIGKGFWSDELVTDDELMARWSLPPLSVRLAKFRLLYALKWQKFAPAILIEMSTADDFDDKSWIEALRHAFTWLEMSSPQDADLPAPDTPSLVTWLHNHQADGARLVRAAYRRYLFERRMFSEVTHGHRRIYTACVDAGVQFGEAPFSDTVDLQQFPCPLCDRMFSSAQALQGHKWKYHGTISAERKYVFSAVCVGCNQCFWTAQRLQQHLKYSKKFENGCFAVAEKFYKPLDDAAKVEKPPELCRVRRLPKCQTDGPQFRPRDPLWIQEQRKRLQDLDDRWQQCGYPASIDPTVYHQISDALTDCTLQWISNANAGEPKHDLATQWFEIIHGFNVNNENDGMYLLLCWGSAKIYDLMTEAEDPDDILFIENAFLQITSMSPMWKLMSERQAVRNWQPPNERLPVRQQVVLPSGTRHSLEMIPDMLGSQKDLLAPLCSRPVLATPKPQGVPVLFKDGEDGGTILIIHLFSGRRRHGDCCYWLQELQHRYLGHLGISVKMLSLDTAVHPIYGNLDEGPNFDLLVELVSQGWVAMNIGGPPCETWSAARHLELPDGRPGPRPLRSRAQPWGLHHLKLRELKQLAMGSKLMLNNVFLDVLTTLKGGVSLKEHPAWPVNPDHASIWRTPLHVELVKQVALTNEVLIYQWKFGAASVKPTVIRTLGMKHPRDVFRSCELEGVQKPDAQLGGLNESGEFRTASAKEYPDAMCKALVCAGLSSLRHKITTEGVRRLVVNDMSPKLADWLQNVVEAGSEIRTDAQWLPDYQPAS